VQLAEIAWTMSRQATDRATTIGVDIGKNAFHFIGFHAEGVIVLRHKLSHMQMQTKLANVPP
jgi:hypothetical protein